MSRIGKSPISIPSGVKVEVLDTEVRVQGPKGALVQGRQPSIEISIEDGTISLQRQGDSGPEKALHGLARALLANAVEGVSTGFKRELEIVGVGYRGEVQGREVHLALGYSHPVVYPIPEAVVVEIDRQNRITLTGPDKQVLGQVAADLRGLRPPDAYKGKGIRYLGEQLRLKEGKTAS